MSASPAGFLAEKNSPRQAYSGRLRLPHGAPKGSLMAVPADAKVYHIVHLDRLNSILDTGGLHCDSFMRGKAHPGSTIGMPDLKRTRLQRRVDVLPDTYVGDYVPFYFCSRSVMLYVIYMRNHPSITYTGGQGPIIHLEADLGDVLDWAEENEVPWAISLGNASAAYAEFRCRRRDLGELKWDLIHQRDFRPPDVKEAKQSELLIHSFFPWALVERIGTHSDTVAADAVRLIQGRHHRPTVQRMPGWYY